jgi:hypothetical protein
MEESALCRLFRVTAIYPFRERREGVAMQIRLTLHATYGERR